MTSKKTFSRRKFLRSSAVAMGLAHLPGIGPFPAKEDPFPGEFINDYTGRLCYNENPLGPSPEAQAAMKQATSMAHRYPDWFSTGLETKIATHHGVSPNNICVGAGATEVIRLVADAFLPSGGEMITTVPTYSQMINETIENGGTAVEVPVDENHVIDLQAISDGVERHTKLISLVNPNNPLGTIVDKTDLEAFIRDMPSYVVTVVDEAYHHYVDSPDYESCIRFVKEGLPVIVVRTFSKVYGLAGARIGYSVASNEFTDLITSSQLFGTVSNLGQAAAAASLDDSQHVSNTVSVNEMARSILESGLTDLGLDFIPSETNFMMFDTGMAAEPVASGLLSLGYQVRTGWGMPRHIRVSTGLVSEMHGFLEALEEVLDSQRMTTGKSDDPVPLSFGLHSVYPNPFNSRCRIKITTTSGDRVMLNIYDTLGRKVRCLLNRPLEPGEHTLSWDGKDSHGVSAASGVYFLSLLQGESIARSRVTLVR